MKREKSELMISAYNRWKLSDRDNIFKAYERPSMNKIDAWEDCERLCKECDGHDLRVIGHNCYKFTAGFIGTVDGKKAFVFITDCYDRYMELED